MDVKNIQPGIYYDIPFNEYLTIPYFNHGMVQKILRSPLALKHYMEADDSADEKEKAQMVFGRLLDCLLLEPGEYSKNFIVRPDTYDAVDKKGNVTIKPWTGQSNTCKKFIADAAESGLSVVSAASVASAGAMVDKIKKHTTASQWLAGKYQVTIIWKDTVTGIYCKGRPDIFTEKTRIVDLKATNDPHPGAFARTANNFGYHVQAAMYSIGSHCAVAGVYPDDYTIPSSFIVGESQAPFDIICYDMDSESLDCGKILFREAIDRYAECVKTDSWPGYSNYAEPLSIPMWAKNKIQLEGVFSE